MRATKHNRLAMPERPTGWAARMDGSQAELRDAIRQFNTTFEEFKSKNDERLDGVAKRFDDVVKRDEVERINNALDSVQTTIDRINEVAAASMAGGDEAAERRAAKNSRRLFRAALAGSKDVGQDAAGRIVPRADSTKAVDEDGGFLVPEPVVAEITRVQAQRSAMRRLANVVSLGKADYRKLHSLGGATSGWVGESAARTKTNTPTLEQINIVAGEIYANPAQSQQILDDADFDAAAWLAEEVGITFDEEEGDAFLNGNGTSKPNGILNATLVADASYAWGSLGVLDTGVDGNFAAAPDGADKLLDLTYALGENYIPNATWLMRRTTLGAVRKLKDSDGAYIFSGPTMDAPASVWSYPVETDDHMPAIATDAVSILFGDFRRGYTIVDRTDVRVLRDPFTNKPFVQFYTTKRVGGGITDYAAIKGLRFAA